VRRLDPRARLGLDAFDLAVLGALAVLSVWVVGWAVQREATGPDVWIGVDALHIADAMQYLAWIRDASSGILIGNPYRLDDTVAAFLHPGFALSGGLVALGVPPWLALLLWKPVACVALFAAVRAFVNAQLPGIWARRAALVLALFCVPSMAWIAHLEAGSFPSELTIHGLGFDMWPGAWLWGYPFTALAVAALTAGLLLYARDREAGRLTVWAPALALLCSWLQPWQGATFLAVVAGGELVARGRRPLADASSLPLPVLTAVAGILPLAYYAALGHWDPSWETARDANLLEVAAWWPVFAITVPLGLVAILAYRLRPVSFLGTLTMLWPPAAIGLYFLIERGRIGTFPLHAVQGLGIPLAVLACQGTASLGWSRFPRPVLAVAAVAAVAALLVPQLAWRLTDAYDTVKHPMGNFLVLREPMFLEPGERDAMRAIERRNGERVLTPRYLGQVVPGYTGARTWVGTLSWTPDFADRAAAADALFSGGLSPGAAQRLVRSSGAGVLLSDCRSQVPLERFLGKLLRATHRYGCATVYEVSVQ
jgi:hypothetical protein